MLGNQSNRWNELSPVLMLSSDQGMPEWKSVQLLKWAGFRCGYMHEPAHRDSRDGSILEPSLKYALTLAGKIPSAPFGSKNFNI